MQETLDIYTSQVIDNAVAEFSISLKYFTTTFAGYENSEAVFLVIFGTISFPAMNELLYSFLIYLVPSMIKNTVSASLAICNTTINPRKKATV